MAYESAIPGSKPKTPIAAPASLVNQYKLANSAVTQQAQDYDAIMQGHKNLLSTVQNQPATSYTPVTSPYATTPGYNSAVSRLTDLASTGGYSPSDIADIRERGISPIRSVYANAQRDINRRNTTSGGVSANYNALKSRMAREESSKIADQVTNVNAQIADRVAGNKIGVANTLGSLTAGEQGEQNRSGIVNAEIQNEASRFNATRNDNKNDTVLRALNGMQSLYGTTPALSSLFGNQALAGASLQNTINQGNINNGLSLIGKNLIKKPAGDSYARR